MSVSLSVVPPADQQRWHELYKAAPLVIILLYMRTRGDRPVTQSEIAENFKIAANTAATAMRKLARLGKIALVSHNTGYILTDGGRQMLLGFEDAGYSKIDDPSLSFLNKDSKDFKKEEEELKKILKNCESWRILAETDKLFPGHAIVTYGLRENLKPEYILAWLAQAYDQAQQGRISKPWGVVYRRLQIGRDLPEKKYQADPLRYLPNEFLVALDLAAPDVIDGEAYDAEPEIVRIREYTSTVEGFVYEAWISVQDNLKAEMPRAAFETWVVSTYPVHYDGDLLSVAVRNQYAVDWLESRLTSTVQRMLVGILNNSNVRVEFVVVTDETEP